MSSSNESGRTTAVSTYATLPSRITGTRTGTPGSDPPAALTGPITGCIVATASATLCVSRTGGSVDPNGRETSMTFSPDGRISVTVVHVACVPSTRDASS